MGDKLRKKTKIFTLSATLFGAFFCAAFGQYYAEVFNKEAEVPIAAIDKIVNGSIIAIKDNKYLLAFRRNLNIYTRYNRTELGFALLDSDFKVIEYNLLNINTSGLFKTANMPQDPRFVVYNSSLYIVYNNSFPPLNQREMFLSKIVNENNKFIALEAQKLTYEPDPTLDQKNWVPFVHDNQLYFIYSFEPYKILRWNNHAKTMEAPFPQQSKNLDRLWPHGEIRGGTPAIYVKELDAYLGFFHSFVVWKKGEPPWQLRKSPQWRRYYVGAYLIENKPPFQIRAFTFKPLSFKGLYDSNDNYLVFFPMGVVEEQDGFIVSAGYQDDKTYILKISKKDLYSNLTAI